MAKGKIWVGTSGWLYPHWKGTFYPKGLKANDQFTFYSLFFNTVELNNPFYRLPSKETFENWRKKSKSDFLYIVKASRYITHMKKLSDTKEAVDLFLHHCNGLEEKLGPVLFQLPPGWEVNIERLKIFLELLPSGYRFAFEFRNPTWYTKQVYALLKKHNCAFCIYQLAGHMSPIEVTADWVYIRLHGPTKNKYQGSYDFSTLSKWALKLKAWQNAGKDVYIYFDNDDSGYAAFNAQLLEMMVNKDSPVTANEAKALATIIKAIKEKKKLRFYYTGNAGSFYRTIEPYLIAIKNKGRGKVFCAGYQYTKDPKSKNTQAQYLLSEIDVKKIQILDETFDELKIDEQKIFGEHPAVRIVYRIAPFKTKRKNLS